jgi:hypothetical protein
VIPRSTSSSIHFAKGLVQGTSLKVGTVQSGGTYAGPSSVRRRKTAICSRVTASFGQ